MAKKSTKSPFKLDLSRLNECNLTELIQIARHAGYPDVSRQMPREEIEALLWGDEVHVEDPLMEVREQTFNYLQGNSVMLSGLTCSTHCPTCPHDRVVDCYSRNHDIVTPPEAPKPPLA